MRLARHETSLSPPVKYVTDRSTAVLHFVDHLCYFCLVFLLCFHARLFIGGLLERADLLALVCDVYCEVVTFQLVSLVRCGA